MRWLINTFCCLQILMWSVSGFAAEGDAEFSVSPDSGAKVLLPLIQRANKSIYMNVYMLTNKNIVEELANKATDGLEIMVITEGEPTGGMNASSKKALAELYSTFKNSKNAKILIMTSSKHSRNRRYVFDHAKYTVVDGKFVFISSDNFTASAFPTGSKATTSGGSRGWQTLVESPSLARELTSIFNTDTNLQNPDVVPYENTKLNDGDSDNNFFQPQSLVARKTLFDAQTGTVEGAVLCHSPRSLDCVIDFIRAARSTLDLEHLSMPLNWGDDINPILQEVVAAAKRGVKVRVLLNDEATFGDKNNFDGFSESSQKNEDTVKWLLDTAQSKKLPLDAALFDAKAVQVAYVHNKGMVADRSRTFVSSINGTQNSVENNREVAISLNSRDAGNYFSRVYEFDWSNRQSDYLLRAPLESMQAIFGMLAHPL